MHNLVQDFTTCKRLANQSTRPYESVLHTQVELYRDPLGCNFEDQSSTLTILNILVDFELL
jgi:hypothetical protein